MTPGAAGYSGTVPELPDVEGFRREAAEHAAGQRVESVLVRDPQVVHLQSADDLDDLLRSRYFGQPWRHGKWLVLPTAKSRGAPAGHPSVLVHFGMTGLLRWCPQDTAEDRHERVVFQLSNGQLRYVDMRKLKGIEVARNESDMDRLVGKLGPDAYAVSRDDCRARLTRTRRGIKAALLDQTVLAGLGNLCADEILWQAHLHPEQRTTDLTDADWNEFHRHMRSMLRQSVKAGRVPDRKSWLTGHRDEPDGRCPRCSTPLEHTKTAGRSTVQCPKCQPFPR